MQQQRIGLLLDSRCFGGIETHVYALAQALVARDVSVIVIFINHYGPHPLFAKLTTAAIPYITLDGRFRSCLALLQQKKLTIIHSHGYKASIFAKLAGKWLGIPVVETYHSGDPGQGKVRIYTWLDQRLAFLATNIAVSSAIAQQLSAPVTVIPNFVQPPATVGPVPNAGKVIFVGRWVSEKGPDLFCQLRDYLPATIQLTLIGSGPMEVILRQHYPSGIDFAGSCDDLSVIWPKVDLLCITSRYEGLPLVALEAMAYGVPVVAFAVGGLPQLIVPGYNGFLAPIAQVTELARCIMAYQALSRAEKQNMANQARTTVLQTYSTAVVVPQIMEIYASVRQFQGNDDANTMGI